MDEPQFNYTINEAQKLKELNRIADSLEKLASCVHEGNGGKKYFDTNSGFDF